MPTALSRLTLVALILLFPNRATAQQPAWPRDAGVDSIMNRAIKPDEPGSAVVVIWNGRVVHGAAYGLADLETGRPNRTSSTFHMASMGKQFTALALLILRDEGKLSLDDPIGKHFPELARFGPTLTVRQILHHTSGIPDYYNDTTGYRKLLELAPEPDNRDIVKLLAAWGEAKPAGTEFSYSNAGYDLLGSLVETLSGMSLDAFLQQRVFGPAGMGSTFSLPNTARFADSSRSRGYDKTHGRWVADDQDPLDRLVGSGSVYSSVEDLYRYDQALYGERLVKQSELQEMYQPVQLEDGRVVPYGFGWRRDEKDGVSYLDHGGAWEGYLSHMIRIPDRHFSIFILDNRTDFEPEDLSAAILERYLPELR
ncbi:MAG: serine hydrolase domain-containing protein [Gemmatimonadota bacterium]